MDSLRRKNIINNQVGKVTDLRNTDNHIFEQPKPEIKQPQRRSKIINSPQIEKHDPEIYISDKKNLKEGTSKKWRIAASVALFVMVVFFAAIIGWYEFKNEDNSLDKLLARYKTETKTISEPNKESTSNSTAKAMQSPTQPVQASQSVPNDDNLGIGATNQEKIEEVADKKNFENSEISFGYPSEYKIEENNGQVTVIKEEAMWRMKIYDNKNKKELTQWFSAIFSGKENADCVWSDPLTLKIGDLATKLAKASTASGKCDGTGYFAMNTDKTKIIRIRLDKADETEANEILASFKFIK